MAKERRTYKRLAVLLLGTLVLCGLALFLANAIFDLNVEWRLYLLRIRLFGDPEAPLCQPDERFGWRLRPGATYTARNPDFRTTYTIGADGDRIVPCAPTSGPTIAFLGGSFTMGTGVNDDEPFPSILQRRYWPSYRIRNMACKGYSTSHALLRLQDELRTGPSPHLVIYCWIYHHLHRNYRRRSWLAMLAESGRRFGGAQDPLFEVRDGILEYKGTVGLQEAIPDDDPGLVAMEWQVTRALLRRLHDLCQEHKVPFVVVILPNLIPGTEAIDLKMASTCRTLGLTFLDLSVRPCLLLPNLYYPRDVHPNASWHKQVARVIAEHLDPQTAHVR